VPGDLLHGRLHPEGAVSRVDQATVVEVHLELARAELMIGRSDLEPGRAQVTQGPQQQAVGVALAAHDVDIAGAVGVPGEARARGTVRLADEVLQLRPDDGLQLQLREVLGDPSDDRPRRFRRRRAVGEEGVSQAGHRPGLPGQRRQCAQVRLDVDVGQAVLDTALDLHHVTHGRGVVDAAAEREAVPERSRQLRQEHVTPPVDADHVRVRHPDHINVLRPKLLDHRGDVLAFAVHDSSGIIVRDQT
jgi:hypothetical protein